MSKEQLYSQTAKDILNLIGGKDNISSAAHCATRLRLVLKDDSLIKKESELELNLIFSKEKKEQCIKMNFLFSAC